jgi:propionyl-CoA carboxylase alpha chain
LNAPGAGNAEGELRSPMLGVFVRWIVAEGDHFAIGDPLCVLEAMKMEMVLRAERPGMVTQIMIAPGESVEADMVLMQFT